MKSSDNNFLRFLRRNAAYLVLALCILAIGLSVTLVLVNKNRDNQLKNDTPVIVTPSNDDQKEPIIPDPEPVVKPEGYMDGELLIYELTVDEATGDDVYTPVDDDNLLEALIDMLNDELEKSMEYDN